MDRLLVQGESELAGYVALEAWQVELLVPVGTSDRHVEIMRHVLGEGLAVMGQHVTSRGVTISLEAARPGAVDHAAAPKLG
jgi:hypothetical protein